MTPGNTHPRTRFRAVLGKAKAALRAAAFAESALAAGIGALLALTLALWLLHLLPFSSELRLFSWGLLGSGAILGGVWRVRGRLFPLSDPQVVARHLEEAANRRGVQLADDVRSAVDLLDPADDDRSGRSRALCDAHIERTTDRLLEAQALGSMGQVALGLAVPTLLSASGMLLIAGLCVWFFPVPIRAGLARLFDGQAAAQALQQAAASRLPLVTDLDLVLRFPAYMAREDVRISGATGDIEAPLGTQVEFAGRADRALRDAYLLLGDTELAVEVKEGRRLVGQFVVQGSGAYRFKLVEPRGTTELDPVAHLISVVPDETPRVELKSPTEDNVVQLDDEVDVAFAVKDDFGLGQVRLVVRKQDSSRPPFEQDVARLGGSVAAFQGQASFRVADTGARPGDRLSVYVEAFDNDTVTGPKSGRSETRVLTVFSTMEHHRKLLALEEKLLDQMVHVLADELEHPVPVSPAPKGQAAQSTIMADQEKLDDAKRTLLQVLSEVLTALADDSLTPEGVRRALANMRSDLRPPIDAKSQLVQSAVRGLAQGRELLPYVFRNLAQKGRDLVRRLETHIVYLEDMLNTQRIQEAKELAEELARTQKELRELLDEYRKAPSDALRQELLEEIARLRAQMQELMARMAALQREVPDEYLNQEAFDSQEMLQDSSELDRLIEEGKLEEAAEMLQKMVEQTQELVENLQESEEEYGGEEYRALREKLEQFGQELSSLKASQEELMHRSDRLLDAARQQAERKLKDKLDQALKELQQKVVVARDALQRVDSDALFALEQEESALALARAQDLLAALEARDLEDALRAAMEAKRAAQVAERSLADRTRGRFGSRNPQTLAARDALQQARPLLEEVYDALHELMPDPVAQLSETQRKAMQKDAARQAELKQRTQKLVEQMNEIAKEMPIFGPSHQAGAESAGQHMGEAGRKLGRGELRSGRSQQRMALQDLQALEESMSEMGKGNGSGLPMPLPGGGAPGSEQGGNGRRSSKEKVKIPGVDEFQVPDAFRRDILDAMREGPPESWAPEVRRYYEELVK